MLLNIVIFWCSIHYLKCRFDCLITASWFNVRNSQPRWTMQLFLFILILHFCLIFLKFCVDLYIDFQINYRISALLLGVQLCFCRFFSEIRGFIVKNWLYIYDSKYCLSLTTTFSHLSGSVRIPRRKNWSSFEAIHESIQFFISS